VTDTGCEVLDLRDGEDVTFYERRSRGPVLRHASVNSRSE